MLKLLFLFIYLTIGSAWAQEAGVELQLTSPLIVQDGIEVDISSTPIDINNPCSHMALNPFSCSYNSSLGVLTAVYSLEIAPFIPAGKKGILNVNIANSILNGFESVRILQNGAPVATPLAFDTNTQSSYQIEFQIKITGQNVPQQPQVNINFLLEEQIL